MRQLAMKDDFILLLDRHSAWPHYEHMHQWLRQRKLGFRENRYTRLKGGFLLPESCAFAVTRYLVEATADDAIIHARILRSRRLLSEYLRPRGVASLAALTEDELLNHLTTEDQSDGLLGGWAPIANWLVKVGDPGWYAHGCTEAGTFSLEDAIRNMMQACGNARNPALDRLQAITWAEDIMGITTDDYLRQAEEWWQFNPWTVLNTVRRDELLAVTIVLPVTHEAFERVLTGRAASFELGSADLAVPSANLILEAGAICATKDAVRTAKSRMRLSLAAQCAALARLPLLEGVPDLRVLSFEGTEENAKALMSTGFQHTGTHMARTSAKLLLKTVPGNSGLGRDWFDRMILKEFHRLGDSPPPGSP